MQIKARIQAAALILNRQGRLKKNLSIVSAVVTLALIGSLMSSRQSVVQGAGGPTVTIDPTQLPLPVQGSVAVSGTMAATQSGVWSVGLTGTPSVAIANSPTVHLGNTTGSPGIVLDADKATRIPYQSVASNPNCLPGFGNCLLSFTGAPAGFRLVVENISGYFVVPFGTTAPPSGFLYDSTGNGFWGFQGGIGENGPGGQINSTFNQNIRGYFDSSDGAIMCQTTASFSAGGKVTLTGYLENCAVVGCPAIQR